MMNGHGGARPGAGRKRGGKDRRTREIQEAGAAVVARISEEIPAAFDGDGVALLQVVYKDPAHPIELRVDAAFKAARYERPALAATLTRDMTPIPSTPAAINQRIEELLRKGLGGGIAVVGS